MSKAILYCADGTWNGPGDPANTADIDASENPDPALGPVTNVVKLFKNLEGAVTAETQALPNEQEKVLNDGTGAGIQVAKYMHGVGDSSDLVVKAVGGAFGVGVIARVVRGYTYISRQYQPGDSIHIVGFSRGAYTARALAGMICAVGLLNPAKYDVTDKEKAYVLGYASAECGLSNLALNWMMEQLASLEVRFASPLPVVPDLTHYTQDFHKPWETPPFNVDPQPRVPLKHDTFSRTVQERWNACTPYQACWPNGFAGCKLV